MIGGFVRRSKYDQSKTKEAFDNYSQALYAILAFVNEVRWDAANHKLLDFPFGIGRRFTTSASNEGAPSTDVIPDCAVQSSSEHGIVAEAKLRLPKNKDYWDGDILQLKKYDDDLTGWWTETEHLSQHDIVALVPLLRAVDFSEHVDDGISQAKWTCERYPSVVGFQRLSGPEKT